MVSRLTGRVLNRTEPYVPWWFKLRYRYLSAVLLGGEPELMRLECLGPNQGLAIDVGANCGLYTHRLASLYESVVALEINPALAAGLAKAAPRNVVVRDVGLSDHAGRMTLHIPIAHGMTLTGWSSLHSGNCPDATEEITTSVDVVTLDSIGLDPAFIKADVEGHEVAMLAGARATIERSRPVVLIEVKESNRHAVREYFSELGYQETNLAELIGVQGSPENLIYLPTAPPPPASPRS